MSRKNRNARPKRFSKITFRELCRRCGITPRQRLQIVRYLREKGGIR